MKKIAVAMLALLLCPMFSALAQFEGLVDMKITSFSKGKPEEMQMSMSVKKDLMAMDIKGKGDEGGRMIIRADKKVMWMVRDQEKMYLEFPLKENSVKSGKAAAQGKSNAKKTGKTQTILGYECEEWVTEDGDAVTSMWVTSKLGNLLEGFTQAMGKLSGMGGGAAAEPSGWKGEMAKMKMFPLKTETTKNGKPAESMEVTKVEQKTLPQSTFEAPSGYRKQSLDFDMNKMMEQMQKQMQNKKDKE